jgi:hypothetical protein
MKVDGNGDCVGVLLPPQLLLHADEASGLPGSRISSIEGCTAVVAHAHRVGGQVCLFAKEEQSEAMSRDLDYIATIESRLGGSSTVLPISALSASLKSRRFIGLHDFSGPFLDKVAYARSMLASQVFPVTCRGMIKRCG